MDVELTELEKLEVTRVDAVTHPANGFPALIMKGVAKGQRDCPKCDKSYDADHQGATCENCGTKLPDADASKAADDKVDCPTCKGDGKMMGNKRDCPDCDATGKVTPAKAKTLAAKSLPDWHAQAAALVKKAMVRGKVDESADIDGGNEAIALVGKLIGYEAQELAAGNLGETADIELLSAAASLLRTWVTGESAVQDGNVMPATALMQSAAKAMLDEAAVYKDRNYSAAERKEMAGDGRALPDGSYPINDEHDLNSAAILARSGHGDVDAAKKHIGKRAKELGVKNPLDDSQDGAAKGVIAQEEATVDTVTQDDGRIAKAVEDALAKAVAPLKERIEALGGELAKVKATPIPGGFVLSGNVQVKRPGGVQDHDIAAKAALMRAKAEAATAPADREGYLALARELDAEARKAVPSA